MFAEDIIIKPVLTEKGYDGIAEKKYSFYVKKDANKAQIKAAVEKIFGVAGIGKEFVSSITNRDYPMVMGTTIILASLIVIMNLVGDILYKVVDPRITLE